MVVVEVVLHMKNLLQRVLMMTVWMVLLVEAEAVLMLVPIVHLVVVVTLPLQIHLKEIMVVEVVERRSTHFRPIRTPVWSPWATSSAIGSRAS